MVELKKTEGRTLAQNQQVGLAKEILQGEIDGGKTKDGVKITPGNVYMARMLATANQSAVLSMGKFLEPTPSGTAVAFVTMAPAGQNGTELVNFCRRGMVVLTAEIDVDKRRGYLAANENGVFVLFAKEGWNITNIMTRNFDRVTNPDQTVILNDGLDTENISMLPVSGQTVEALFQKTLEESKANPFKFSQSVEVVEEANDTRNGLSDTDQLKVLKLFQSNLPIESDFNYVVEGARGFSETGRTEQASLDQIYAIRERMNQEVDPLKRYACKVQLAICEQFLKEKKALFPEWGNRKGPNWDKYLQDKRSFLNKSGVKFIVKGDYIKKSLTEWEKSEGRVKEEMSQTKDKYNPQVLEQLIVDKVVKSFIVTFLSNVKFDNEFNIITKNSPQEIN